MKAQSGEEKGKERDMCDPTRLAHYDSVHDPVKSLTD